MRQGVFYLRSLDCTQFFANKCIIKITKAKTQIIWPVPGYIFVGNPSNTAEPFCLSKIDEVIDQFFAKALAMMMFEQLHFSAKKDVVYRLCTQKPNRFAAQFHEPDDLVLPDCINVELRRHC